MGARRVLLSKKTMSVLQLLIVARAAVDIGNTRVAGEYLREVLDRIHRGDV